jgi:hypothetical protein
MENVLFWLLAPLGRPSFWFFYIKKNIFLKSCLLSEISSGLSRRSIDNHPLGNAGSAGLDANE